jgi:hypothetical protein
MFNRFFCYLLLIILGINFLSFNTNIKSKAVDLQKPYISEVWHGNSDYSDKCTSLPIKSKTAIGYCPMDTWIEITNPSSLSISLNGYSIDVTSNRGFVEQGGCEELDLESTKGKRTDTLLCQPTKIQDKALLGQTVAPNSQILFQQKYGTIINMLTRAGFSAQKLDLVRRGASIGLYSANLIDNTGATIDTFSGGFGASASVQICLDENGNKKQTNSTKSFQAGEKIFYGTPGAKNDCPEIVKEIPITPPPKIESLPKETPKPDPVAQPISTPATATEKQPEIKTVSKGVNEKPLDLPQKNVTPINTPQQAQVLPIPKIEIKAEPKVEIKKILPVTFKVEPETIQVKSKPIEPSPAIKSQPVEVKKEIIQEVKQKPSTAQNQQANLQNTKPLLNIQKTVEKPNAISKPTTNDFKASIIPSVQTSIVNQIKTIKLADDNQNKIFGVEVTKSATVDMHTIKVNFIYFDIAIILFLLTKTTLENKQYTLKLLYLVKQKVFQSK